MIRKATETDIPAVAEIYEQLHSAEEAGQVTIGWIRGVYPTEDTARQALERDDLFVEEANGKIVGAAILNQRQMDAYYEAEWRYAAKDQDVMVLHTLVISPEESGEGSGKNCVAL